MEVAQSTIVLLLFLLPGFFFKELFLQGTFDRSTVKRSTFEETATIIAASFVIHSFCAAVLHWIRPEFKISFSIFDSFFKGENTNLTGEEVNRLCLYNFSVWIISFFSGILFRWIILHFHLHRYFRFLRLANPWEYILRGEIVFFRENEGVFPTMSTVDMTYLDILVKGVDINIIYRGILVDYVLKDGILDSISVNNVSRRVLDNPSDARELANDPTLYFPIPGNALTVFGRDILNVNITYVEMNNIQSLVAHSFNAGRFRP